MTNNKSPHLLTVLLVQVLLATMLVACRNQATPAPQQSTTPQQAQAAAQQSSTPAPPPLPEIIGLFDPTKDGTEFVAVPVLNECGTVGKPIDCIVKKITVSTPPYYLPGMPHTDVDTAIRSYDINQVTFQLLEEGMYETFACATTVFTSRRYTPDDADPPSKWNCEAWKDPRQYNEFVVGHKFRLGRKGEIISFREADQEMVYYFLSLGRCSSVHECQNVARKAILPNFWWENIPPDAWGRYRDYAARQEQRNTPR
jgi:hypothetical protein